MDLPTEADRLRLDLLAIELSAALGAGDVPHALLKGPSTANWLYDPPRAYRDVDLLVAPSRLARAAQVLVAAGLARQLAGAAGEEADHSLLLTSTAGFEVDLHRSLPALPVHGDDVWRALQDHLAPLDLGVGVLPALDEPARCLVLALHAVGNPQPTGQPVEDLRRARAAGSAQSWAAAEQLADTLAARDLFEAGVALVDPGRGPVASSARARLYAAGAPSGALALERLAGAPLRRLPGLLARELVPTRGFLQAQQQITLDGHVSLLRAHARRWRWLLRGLPTAFRAWQAARREESEYSPYEVS